jgi:hypothetical protein
VLSQALLTKRTVKEGRRQQRQIPVYTWLVVVDDDEFLRVVIR